MGKNPLFTKKRKTMKENPSNLAVARWIYLPNDILVDIFNRLGLCPTTSVTFSATTFDIELGEYDLYDTPLLWNILDNLFTIFANLPLLKTFSLQLPNTSLYVIKPSSWHVIASWARRLRQHNLQHFEVKTYRSCVPYGGYYRVNIPSAFRINSLVSLDLNLSMYEFLWCIPNSIDLPNLKKLSLILADYKNLGILIRSCPSLRDLNFTIHKVQKANKDSIQISSKRLKRLNVCLYGSSSILELIIIDAPKLKHLNFSSDRLSCDELIFDSITHVKSLTLLYSSPLLHNYPTTTKTTIFPNMTRLTLALGNFKKLEDLSSMLHCPNLEELVLEVTSFYGMDIPQKPKVNPFEHMKRLDLEIKAIRLDGELLELAAYILRSAPVLEKLILYAKSSYIHSNNSLPEDEFYRSLYKYPRISSHCQIELSGAYGSPTC
ncbi:FBD-associated F-box protein At5g22730-like [Silene latifolia]|uniref:FBD-associated F-box protein At5g22730-like n=1 Tax=Silene latifolia TaxID=37657 RepID=UPI003D787C2A